MKSCDHLRYQETNCFRKKWKKNIKNMDKKLKNQQTKNEKKKK